MRIIARLLLVAAGLIWAGTSALAQGSPTPQYLLNCVVDTGSCTGAWNSLADTTLGTTYPVVAVAGFISQGDGGGGTFALGASGCSTVAGASAQDAAHNCYYRMNYNGSPLGWGAGFTGAGDEYTALDDWLNSSGLKLMGTAGTAVVEEPLSCTDGGRAVFFQANPVGTGKGDGPPPILIQAHDGDSLLGGSALISVTQPNCRFSGIALQGDSNGNYFHPPGGLYDGIDVASFAADHLHLDDGTWIASFNENIDVLGTGNGEAVDFNANDIFLTYGATYNLEITAGGTDWTVLGSKFAFPECNKDYMACPTAGGQNISMHGTSDGIFVANLLENSGNNCGGTRSGAQSNCPGNVSMNLSADEGIVVTGNAFNSDGCDALELNNSQAISVVANKFHAAGNAGDSACGPQDGPAATTAFIELGSNNLNLVVGGNAFYYDSLKSATAFGPDYVYQCAGSSPCAAEWSDIDPWVPPGAAAFLGGTAGCNDVWSTAGAPWLCGRFADQQTANVVNSNQHPDWKNYITGLGLTWNSNTKVTIAIGQATDSGNAAVIMPFNTCQIDLSTAGPTGLDSGTVQEATTYYLYVGMLQPGEAAQDGKNSHFYSCMASTSYPTPTLSFPTTGATNGTTTLAVSNSNGAYTGAKVSVTTGTVTTSAPTAKGGTTLDLSSVPANLVANAPVWDITTPGALAPGTTVMSISGGTVTLSTKTVLNIGGPPKPDTIAYSDIPYSTTVSTVVSGTQVTLSAAALASTASEPVTFSDQYPFWRAAGVIETDQSDTHIPQFAQVENRITYATPIQTTQGISHAYATSVTLLGAPIGSSPDYIQTKVQGKCYAAGIAFNLAGSGQAAPATGTLSPTAVFPFDLYTDTAGHISAIAASGTPTLTCEVDSYEWARGF